MGIIQKTARLAILILAMSSTAVLFQNCSSGFKMAVEASGAQQSSILSAPEITFTNSQDLYTSSDINVQFVTKISSGDSLMSITCQLNTQAAQDCSSRTMSYSGLADGDYTLIVVATTAKGMRTEARKIFRKDATAPVLTVSMMPASVTNSTSAQFVFVASDNLSGVQSIMCSLDNAAFANCLSPINLSALAAGSHNFRIQARDSAGNMNAPYSYNWTIDLMAPTVILSATPAPFTNSVGASFSFSGTGIVSYECQIDNGAYAACTSPQAYNNLAAIAHTFRVRGSNGSGVQSAAVNYSWTIDNVAPSSPTLSASVAAVTNSRSVSFNFSSSDAVSGIARYECSLDNAAFALCVSPLNATNVADGSHNLRVRALDNATNVSAIATFSWLVDGTAPAMAFTQTPAVTTTATTATFAFTATDANISTVQCSLDNAAFANCTSPVNASNLSVAAHNYRVQARDTAGNTTLITYNWTITSSPPPPPSGNFQFVIGMDLTAPPSGLAIPAVNVPYIDSAYKTTVTRVTTPSQVTDAVIPAWIRHEYSRRPAFNVDSSQAIMMSGNGWFRLYSVDKSGNKMNFVKTLAIGEPQEPNWHPTNPNIIYTFPYYGEGMTISEFNVQTNTATQTRNLASRVKAIFPQATSLWTKQEGRPSNDGKIWCLLAMTYDSASQTNLSYGLISYNYETDQILGNLPMTTMPDHISTSPSGKFCVPSWAYNPTLGTRSYTLDFKSYKMLHTQSEHSDLALTKDGRDVYVVSDYDSGDVAMVDLETGSRTNLFRLYGDQNSSTAMHFSGIGTKFKPGYVVAGFYGCTTNYGSAACPYSTQWFNNKVVLIELNANPKIYNLAHTHFGDAGYFSETQAVSNNDFSKVLFVSSWETTSVDNVSSYMINVPIDLLP